MAIGAPINPGIMNDQVGQIAVNLRNACQSIVNMQNTLVAVGQPALVAAGFTSTDATNLMTAVNQLNTIAQVYYGTATQATMFNFNNVGAPLTGGS